LTQIQVEPNSIARNGSYRFPELSYLGLNTWWRYVVSFALLASGWVVLQMLGRLFLGLVGKHDVVFDILQAPSTYTSYPLTDSLLAFSFLLWSIVSVLIPFILFIPVLHDRPLATFIFNRQFNWAGFRLSLEAALIVPGAYLIYVLVLEPGSLVFQFQPGPWFAFLLVALALVPLQIFAEEIVFRGYLLQMIGRSTKLYLVRLIVPALVFAGLHAGNPEVTGGGQLALASYFVASLYLGFLVLWGDGLEYALGLHLGNNLFGALILSSSDSIFGAPTLFVSPPPDWSMSMLLFYSFGFVLHFMIMMIWIKGFPRKTGKFISRRGDM